MDMKKTINIEDVVQTAFEVAAKFDYSYNVYWNKNDEVIKGAKSIKSYADVFKEFLLEDNWNGVVIPYEYKKIALKISLKHFQSLQDRLEFNLIVKNQEKSKELIKNLIESDLSIESVISNAVSITLGMLEMEKNITNDLEKEFVPQQNKSIRKVK